MLKQAMKEFLNPNELNAFVLGYELALRMYGVYKNGVQRIGAMESPTKDLIQEAWDLASDRCLEMAKARGPKEVL